MSEQERLEEVYSYRVLDTPYEKELDDLAKIASALFDAPIALITILDDKRQWFKAKVGLNIAETPKSDSFCQHSLSNPKKVLVVEDALADDRFKDNPLVTGRPYIRFYAGAPLVTPRGHSLGTLCVIDTQPRRISEHHKYALQLLAEKVMDMLNARMTILNQKEDITRSATQLRHLTDNAPGVIYQMEMEIEDRVCFTFISKGITRMHPDLEAEKVKRCASLFFDSVYEKDIPHVTTSLKQAYQHLAEWNTEFRMETEPGQLEWYQAKATPEKAGDRVIWYGTFQNITDKVEYAATMEQLAHDISHVLRRPVTTLLGLMDVIDHETMNEERFKTYCRHIKTVSEELEAFTRKLTQIYGEKRYTAKNTK